jgi:hypothetical protein
MVELRDGSAWRIWPGDIPKTLQWLPTTEIDVADIEDEICSHALVDRSNGSRVRVISVSAQWPTAAVRRCLRTAEQPPRRLRRVDVSGSAPPSPHGSKFAVTAFAAALYFRASCLGAAGTVRRHPIALRPGKGQLSRRIGRERTCCTCLWLTRLQVRRGLHGGGDHASHSIHCRPAQGRMADQVR